MNLISWNVNGIRAIVKKDFLKSIAKMDPDVFCLQETKAQVEDVKTVSALIKGYDFQYVNSSKARKGYSGTAIYSKTEPVNVTYDIGIEDHDQEGRVITAEYQDFFLVTVYVPNSGQQLARLGYRKTWDEAFRDYLKGLEKKKPVIVCGDFNVAHQEIDLANPKRNYDKTAGYTQQEIDEFNILLDSGFIDSWRAQHPEEIKYSYWNQIFNARASNKGWRIDYFLVSEALKDRIVSTEIYNEYFGSDHCPVGLEIR